MSEHNTTQFRCPFQVKGENESTILEVVLPSESSESRIMCARKAFEMFHAEHSKYISLRFRLPSDFFKMVNSNEALKPILRQYQIEIVAAELDYRLSPLMSYQVIHHKLNNTGIELRKIFEKYRYKFAIGHYINLASTDQGIVINNILELAGWINYCMNIATLQPEVKNPQLFINDEEGNVCLSIGLSSITIHPENFEEITGPGKNNRNCFAVVMTPFYPKVFPRYSETVDIVFSRMKDFTTLSSEQRRKIRFKANTIYRDHGIAINDLEEDKQPDGLWIP